MWLGSRQLGSSPGWERIQVRVVRPMVGKRLRYGYICRLSSARPHPNLLPRGGGTFETGSTRKEGGYRGIVRCVADHEGVPNAGQAS